jgi:hypothetical protein
VSTDVSEENIASIFGVEEISSARNHRASRWQAGFLLNLFLRPRRWVRYVLPKRRLTLNGLHGVVSQKMVLFITTAVKTSSPNLFYYSVFFHPLTILTSISALIFVNRLFKISPLQLFAPSQFCMWSHSNFDATPV